MANQLDEMNPEIMAEGRDVHVIAKVIPVETSGFEKLIPMILMAIGVIAIGSELCRESSAYSTEIHSFPLPSPFFPLSPDPLPPAS